MSSATSSGWVARLRLWFRNGYHPDPLSSIDWLMMRVSFAALVLITFNDWHPYAFTQQERPVGIARWINLTWLHHDGIYRGMFWMAVVCCALYAMGIALRAVLPVLLVAQIIVYTYFNSQGFTDHSTQLVSMVLLVQTIVVWWKRGESKDKLRAWIWFYCRGIVLFSYVASALTKIINTRGLWVWRSKYLCIEIIKTRRFDYYKDLDPAFLGDPLSATWLMHHPLATQCMFGAGFFLEAFAFLGLRDRQWSALIGLSLIAMHQSITWLMGLTFENHQWLILIFLVNPMGWLLLLTNRNAKQNLRAAST